MSRSSNDLLEIRVESEDFHRPQDTRGEEPVVEQHARTVELHPSCPELVLRQLAIDDFSDPWITPAFGIAGSDSFH